MATVVASDREHRDNATTRQPGHALCGLLLRQRPSCTVTDSTSRAWRRTQWREIASSGAPRSRPDLTRATKWPPFDPRSVSSGLTTRWGFAPRVADGKAVRAETPRGSPSPGWSAPRGTTVDQAVVLHDTPQLGQRPPGRTNDR